MDLLTKDEIIEAKDRIIRQQFNEIQELKSRLAFIPNIEYKNKVITNINHLLGKYQKSEQVRPKRHEVIYQLTALKNKLEV